MNSIRTLFAVALLGLALPARAQQDVSGIWTGNLPVGDETIEIHFVLTRAPDGSYAAVVTSPDPDGIKDVPATSAGFDGTTLVLVVDDLSGRYEGAFANGAFDGEWRQEGEALPLDLVPYVAPVLSEAAKDLLRGSWVGRIELPGGGGGLAIVFRFEDGDDGEFVGFVDSPDQNATDLAMSDIVYQDGTLEFRIPRVRGEYTGTINGDDITGSWSQGQSLPLNMARGEYVREAITLSQAAIDALSGSWVGKLRSPAGELNVVFRFARNADGKFEAFLDSPDQGARDIPVTEVTLEDGKLGVRVPAVQGSYTATLSGSEIEGTWQQGPGEQPLVLTRGEYTPGVAGLDLSAAAVDRLAGTWRGQMGPLELIIRFETTDDGTAVAFLDVPTQGASGLSIPTVSLEGDQVTISIPAIGATYAATLDGAMMTGEWQQGPATNALTLTRE